ncbi:hypothetical protein BBP40_006618 [Aspergillus hancockii]|nr:hypothetical protein BBP40_006618 [Aspergillus hancockii]
MISSCLKHFAKAIKSSPVSDLVVMSMSNWLLMASQHKVYVVFHGVQEQDDTMKCDYTSASDGSYQQLLEALEGYGTLGRNGLGVAKRRADIDFLYHVHRTSPQTHTARIADSTRSLLNPVTLPKAVDVVHVEWYGDTGDVEYHP